MTSISERVRDMAESATLAMAKKARELRAEGKDIISLSLGEPDFKTPYHIQEAAIEAIKEGKYFSYPPVPGYLDLREAIAHKFKRDNGLDWKPENIVVSTGAKQSIFNVMMSILNAGDEVVIFAPYWVSYADIVSLVQGVPVPVKGGIEQNFKVSAEQVAAAITPKTKAVLFSSPSNPTGSVFSQEELEAIAKVLEPYPEILVISDEIYELINFTGQHFSIGSIPSLKDRTITVNGFSKGFAMTGWRLGYIGAPKEIAKACEKVQGQSTSGANSIAQRAAIAALTGDMEPSRVMAETYNQRRDMVLALLNKIPGIKTYVPQGAFYVFPDISDYFGKSFGPYKINDASDFCLYILNEASVSLVTGQAFGAPEAVRLSYAASDENLIEAISRIERVLAQLK